MTSTPPAGAVQQADVAAPPAATPKEQNLFEKWSYLLADHLETDVESAKQVLLDAPESLDQLFYKLKSEAAVVANAIKSGATGLVGFAKTAQADAAVVGSVVAAVDPSAAPEVAAAEATVTAGAAAVEDVAEKAEPTT